MTVMLERLTAILSSPDTGRLLGRSKLTAFDEVMKLATERLHDPLRRGRTLEDLLEVLPALLQHNLRRETVRAGLLEEISAWVAVEGAKPVRALLADEAHAAALRAEVVAVAGPWLVDFAASPGFRGWLQTHV